MKDYIIILLAVVCFAAQFAFTKLFEGAVKQTLTTALVMLVFTNLIGALLFLCVGGFAVRVSPVSLLWAAVFALVMVPYYVVGIKVLSLGSLAIYSMFMMLGGMILPFFYGIIFLGETVSWGKAVGTALLTLFIILQAIGQKSPGEGSTVPRSRWKTYLFFILCLVIFVLNGMTGVIAKIHEISAGTVDEVSFTVLACALTALLSLMLLPIPLIKDRGATAAEIASTLKSRPTVVMIFIGAAAYTGNFLHLKAAANVPASVQFPLVSGGVIVLSALVSAFFFREKISRREWIAVGGSFLSTVLFAF